MPFTLSHAAVAPIWARTGRSSPTTGLALACGSVAPDLVRHGFPSRFQTPSHTLVAAITTDTAVGMLLFALSVLILGPAIAFVVPYRLRPLAEPFQPTVRWRSLWPVAVAVGAILHVLVDLPSHAPTEWMESGPLITESFNASWLRRVPFSVGGDPYPWYYLNRLWLSAFGLGVLFLAAVGKIRSTRTAAPTKAAVAGTGQTGAKHLARATIVVAGLYGAITTRFYTDSAFERTPIDVAIDVAIGATIWLTLTLLMLGCGLEASQRLRKWSP